MSKKTVSYLRIVFLVGLLFSGLLMAIVGTGFTKADTAPITQVDPAPPIIFNWVSANVTVNGLTAHQLTTDNSTPGGYLGRMNSGGDWTFYWGARVWIRSSSGVENELTPGEPVAVVISNTTGSSFALLNGTWDCPGATMNITDSIVVRIYSRAYSSTYGHSPWQIHYIFTTQQLAATQLSSTTWKICYNTRWYNLLFEFVPHQPVLCTESDLAFFGSRMENIQLVLSTPLPAVLVVRGADNYIYYRIYNTTFSTWNYWKALPGSTNDSPATAVIGNELHVVIRGVYNGQIWHSYVNLIDGVFSGWELLSGSTPSAPTLVSNGTYLCLVALDQYGNIYCRTYSVASRVWGGWVAWPYGGTTATPAASFVGDTLHLVVKGPDGDSLWYSSLNLTNHVFSGWSYLSGGTPSSPTLTTNGTVLALVVRDLYGNIYYRFYDLSSKVWGGWVAWPYGGTPEALGATMLGDQLHVVVKGPDGNSLWHSSVDTSNGAFSGWDYVTGSTPSKPTLTG